MSAETMQLFGPEMLANPYPAYHRWRRDRPVHQDAASGAWLLTRYADVAAVLRSPQASSERARQDTEAGPPEFRAFHAFRSNSMLNCDPPKHTRLRLLVSKAFTPNAVEQLTPFIRRTVEDVLDVVEVRGTMDVMHDLAHALPITVIAQLLGVPAEEHVRLKKLADEIAAAVGNVPSNVRPEQFRQAAQSMQELVGFFRAIVAQRRASPRTDLITALVKAEEAGDRLSEEELFANAVLLLNAGHETTTNLIGNGLYALLRHPQEWQSLRDNPSLVPGAVEEVLRFDSPVQFTTRVPQAEMEVHGQVLPAGATVLVLLGAANRDPEQFDDPDRLDVRRANNKHVAFGLGLHFCLGAPLARLEGRIVFETLLRRLPRLRLEGPTPEYRENFNLRGLKSLAVAFS